MDKSVASLVHWGLFGVEMDSEAYLRELMKIDAKKVGKIEDVRLSEGNLPKGVRGTPWKDEGISRSVWYERLKLEKSARKPSLESKAPWKTLGIHRSTYFEWKKRG